MAAFCLIESLERNQQQNALDKLTAANDITLSGSVKGRSQSYLSWWLLSFHEVICRPIASILGSPKDNMENDYAWTQDYSRFSAGIDGRGNLR
jgi:hypothetical protein